MLLHGWELEEASRTRLAHDPHLGLIEFPESIHAQLFQEELESGPMPLFSVSHAVEDSDN